MAYTYTDTNLIETPQRYMYTKFEGPSLITDFVDLRLSINAQPIVVECEIPENNEISCAVVSSIAKIFRSISEESLHLFIDNSCGYWDQTKIDSNSGARSGFSNSEILENFGIDENVGTQHLLLSIIRTSIEQQSVATGVWMDKLVQRFEVTKKLYSSYGPGFRQGEGTCNDIRLYWLFAIALCLNAKGKKNLKYLNALLKVNDLIGSVSTTERQKSIPQNGMALVIAAEVTHIQHLAGKAGVSSA